MQTNNRKGFTLIELLIVVVIIGILAAIAIPKFANTKEKAYVASMKADLKNLVNVQEAYFADNNQYGSTANLTGKYSVSKGNVMGAITGTATGWSATITNPAVTTAGTTTCGIFAGDAAAPNAAVTSEGAPACY
jgi:prepilin-type N-terminal cleavage/methylation domain-containing protein